MGVTDIEDGVSVLEEDIYRMSERGVPLSQEISNIPPTIQKLSPVSWATIPPMHSGLPDDAAPRLKVFGSRSKDWPSKVKLTEGAESQGKE